MLTFEPGETRKQIRMTVLDDVLDEPDETFMLDLSNPKNVQLDAEVVRATGTIEDDDATVTVAWLARFGRTVTSQVLEAVGERLLGGSDAGTQATLAGHRLEGVEPVAEGEEQAAPAPGEHRTMSGQELLAGSSFRLALAPEGGADGAVAGNRWTAWGRGAATHFAGRDGGLSIEGEVLTGTFGVDRDAGGWLTGLAVARSAGSGGYAEAGGEDRPEREGDLSASQTSVHPYVRVALHERLLVWGLLGYGLGTLEQTEDRHDEQTDIALLLGVLGARATLLDPAHSGGFHLALKSDGYLLRMTSEATAALPTVTADVSRLRLVAEGSGDLDLGARRVLTPTVEIGVRHDDGDVETGAGLELGGGLRFADLAWGFTLAANGRVLLTHADRDYREWGVDGSLRLDPGEPGRGPSLSVDSSYGAPASGVERLWASRDAAAFSAATAAAPPVRLTAQLGYGLQVADSVGLTPTSASSSPTRVRTRGGWAPVSTWVHSTWTWRAPAARVPPSLRSTLSP